MTYQKVIKVGDSLAVVIRAQHAREMKLKRGDWVRVMILVIRPTPEHKKQATLYIWKVPPPKSLSTL